MTDPVGEKCALKNKIWEFQECKNENSKSVSSLDQNSFENHLRAGVTWKVQW